MYENSTIQSQTELFQQLLQIDLLIAPPCAPCDADHNALQFTIMRSLHRNQNGVYQVFSKRVISVLTKRAAILKVAPLNAQSRDALTLQN